MQNFVEIFAQIFGNKVESYSCDFSYSNSPSRLRESERERERQRERERERELEKERKQRKYGLNGILVYQQFVG